eukprot:365533-Chlamydomonas_euryale.AAC.7
MNLSCSHACGGAGRMRICAELRPRLLTCACLRSAANLQQDGLAAQPPHAGSAHCAVAVVRAIPAAERSAQGGPRACQDPKQAQPEGAMPRCGCSGAVQCSAVWCGSSANFLVSVANCSSLRIATGHITVCACQSTHHTCAHCVWHAIAHCSAHDGTRGGAQAGMHGGAA